MNTNKNVVGYIRLSRDEDKENYSSIVTQQDIVREYAESKNLTISKMYIDDNFSGYTFDRPEFNKMNNELELGNIDIIIAKDFSRIGRKQGQAMVFIDNIKEKGARLFLVTDAYDSDEEDDIIGIKAWYNEMYIKDISKKIRASMHMKQKTGELIMGNFYGYKKVRINGKIKLVLDEEVKPIIESIFKLYIGGMGYKKICDVLNEKCYPTPSQQIKKRYEEDGRVFKNAFTDRWQTHMIPRIIQDDIYIGTLRTHKRYAKFMKGKQAKTQKEEQYVFENNHEDMISKEDFELAQSINAKRNVLSYRGKSKYNYIFSGFMRCGDCGFAATGLNILKKGKNYHGYNCVRYKKYGLQQCTNHEIAEEKVLFYFKEFLKETRVEYQEYINNINFVASKNNLVANLDRAKKDLDIANQELKVLLTQKIKDIMKESNADFRRITEDLYTQLEAEKKKKISELYQKMTELQKITNGDIENNVKSTIAIFDNVINAEIPERKHLEQILDKIMVYNDRSVEFKLKVSIDELAYAINQ